MNALLAAVKTYLLARWAEPETKAAVMAAIGTTATALLGHWGLMRPATVSLHTMYTTDIFSAVVSLFPGPVSHLILQSLGEREPPPAPPVILNPNS